MNLICPGDKRKSQEWLMYKWWYLLCVMEVNQADLVEKESQVEDGIEGKVMCTLVVSAERGK